MTPPLSIPSPNYLPGERIEPTFPIRVLALPLEHQRSFESPLYKDYYSQLTDFVEKAIDRFTLTPQFFEGNQDEYSRALASLIKSIQDKPDWTFESLYEYNQNIMCNLRILAIKNRELRLKGEFSQEYYHFATWLSCWMYTKVDLDSAISSFFSSHSSLNIDCTRADCGEIMRDLAEQLNNHPNFLTAQRSGSDYFDPHLSGQLPFKAFKLAKSHTQVIYNSNLVAQFCAKESAYIKVVPEFVEFLSELRKQEKIYLSVVLLDRQSEGEGLSVRAFEKLDQIANWVIIILDKTSNFYFQVGEYGASQLKTKVFKQQILAKMFDLSNNSFFYWSNTLDKTVLKKICRRVIREVFEEHFRNYSDLTVSDRRVAIDIIYAEIIEKLCLGSKSSYCGISCKNMGDRTSSMLSLLYINQALKLSPQISSVEMLKTIHLQFAPTLLGYSRSPAEIDLNRNIKTIQHLQTTALKKANFFKRKEQNYPKL